jgi:hypothetical protein
LIRTDLEAVLGRLGWPVDGARFAWLQQRLLSVAVSLVVFFALLSPLLVMGLKDWLGTRSGFETRIEDTVIQDVSHAEQVIDYLNARTSPQDVVLASPHVVWALDSRATDFQQALAYQGIEAMHMPGNLPQERFVFACGLADARYVVVDRLWRTWASAAMPEVAQMVATVETWPLEYRLGEFEVYRNPDVGPEQR